MAHSHLGARAGAGAGGSQPTPTPTQYARRRPERTVLHQVVVAHAETAFADVRAASPAGVGFPRHVEREFRAFAACGILGKGFLRVRCSACGVEELVAFSCHGRGFCPSCIGRRMADTSTRLVDDVLPHVGYRQWVFTFPYRMRPALAFDKVLWTQAIRIGMAKVFAWQRKMARRLGHREVKPLGLCMGQRFGSLLQLNPHGHAVVAEGVLALGSGAPTWVNLPAPTRRDVEDIAVAIVRGISKMLGGREAGSEDDEASTAFAYAEAASIARIVGRPSDDDSPAASPSVLSAVVTTELGRFSVHAHTEVAADDRGALERLIRYGLRPPLAQNRLSLTEAGNVRYRLRKPYFDGRTEVVLSPTAFVKRLAAFVPPKGQHVIRYFGLLAPRAKHRADVLAATGGDVAADGTHRAPNDAASGESPPRRSAYRKAWATLLARVFLHAVLECKACGGERRIVAGITERKVVVRILDHLGLPTEIPELARARPPPPPHLPETVDAEPDWVPYDESSDWDPA